MSCVFLISANSFLTRVIKSLAVRRFRYFFRSSHRKLNMENGHAFRMKGGRFCFVVFFSTNALSVNDKLKIKYLKKERKHSSTNGINIQNKLKIAFQPKRKIEKERERVSD